MFCLYISYFSTCFSYLFIVSLSITIESTNLSKNYLDFSNVLIYLTNASISFLSIDPFLSVSNLSKAMFKLCKLILLSPCYFPTLFKKFLVSSLSSALLPSASNSTQI